MDLSAILLFWELMLLLVTQKVVELCGNKEDSVKNGFILCSGVEILFSELFSSHSRSGKTVLEALQPHRIME